MNKEDIEQTFYNVLRHKLRILDFEKWVYECDESEIDEHFGKGFYFELICLNYKDKYILNELEKLLYSKVHFERFEEIKIRDILQNVIHEKGNLVELIEELYDLYCDGYSFLRYLGLAYVFNGMPREHDTYSFSEKSKSNLKKEALRIHSFLETRKIIITTEYKYSDYREEYEKVELHSLEKMYLEYEQENS